MFDYLNHINDLYPIRRKAEQKENFRNYVLEESKKIGYDVKVDKIKEHNNIVIGNPETAKVIFTAHYDTPAASLHKSFAAIRQRDRHHFCRRENSMDTGRDMAAYFRTPHTIFVGVKSQYDLHLPLPLCSSSR